MREQKYDELWNQLKYVVHKDNNLISNMAIISAELMLAFNFHWVGFYLVDEDSQELYLGPYQGPLPCTRIGHGKGVCGTSWAEAKTFVVDDVHKFSGHIACSALSNSEIVVPLIINGKVVAVLDIDSKEFNDFNDIDKKALEQLMGHLSEVSS